MRLTISTDTVSEAIELLEQMSKDPDFQEWLADAPKGISFELEGVEVEK